MLGPVLFLINANYISTCTPDVKCILNADDTNLLASDKDIDSLSDRMDETYLQIGDCYLTNGLALDVEKTQYRVFQVLPS